VVISSGAALRSFPWASAYGATKAAQRGFAETLRHELSGTGVGLTVVYPGEVATELHAHELDRLPDWNRAGSEAAPPGPLAEKVLEAVEHDRRAVYYPRSVRLLGIAHGVSPKLADRLLRALRGGTAAPRAD
jgi:short-subunit dehydrogenase